MATRVWLGLRRQPRLPQVCGWCGGDRDVLAEQGAGPGRRFGCLHRIVDGYPVLGVVPGRGGQDRMRLGWVRRVRGVGDVGAV